MFSFRRLRTSLTVLFCTSAATISILSPAIAQSRTLYLSTGEAGDVVGYFSEGEAIYASCGFRECEDIDLYLYDASGALVASDEELNSIPQVYAPYSGEFRVSVQMYECFDPSCEVSFDSEYGF